jgi:hypothetical protein
MKNTPLEQLAARYAENRARNRNVQKAISNIRSEYSIIDHIERLEKGDRELFDFSDAREEWYEDCTNHWCGWGEALKHSETEFETCELVIASLYDQKVKLRGELGNIRRSICRIGTTIELEI